MSDVEPVAPSSSSQLIVRLIPRVGQALATYREERYEERLKAFLEESFRGLGAERVVDEIEKNSEFANDLDRAIQAATSSVSEDKIRLLARVLRAELVATDRAAVDNVQQILRVAIELDPVDIRAMIAISSNPQSDPMDLVRSELRATSATAYAIRSRLVRLGLVESEAEASVATPGDEDDDEVLVKQRWSTTPVFEAVMFMLDDFKSPRP